MVRIRFFHVEELIQNDIIALNTMTKLHTKFG
jgi:hypothetical protein